MNEENPESKSLHSEIEFAPDALKLLAEWGVVVRGTQIINTRPAARFADLPPSGFDLLYSRNLKKARLYIIDKTKVGLMVEFIDGTIRNMTYENSEIGVREIME